MRVKYIKAYGSGGREGWAKKIEGWNDDEKGARAIVGPYLTEGENNLEEGDLVAEMRPYGVRNRPEKRVFICRVENGELVDTGEEFDLFKESVSLMEAIKIACAKVFAVELSGDGVKKGVHKFAEEMVEVVAPSKDAAETVAEMETRKRTGITVAAVATHDVTSHYRDRSRDNWPKLKSQHYSQ